MRLTIDHDAQMSYLRLMPNTPVHRTEILEEESVVVDYDRDGRIVGFELFGVVEVVD